MEKENSEYNIAHGERDNHPYFFIFRKGFAKFPQKENYPWLLEIKIYFEANESGLVDGEEGDILNKFEDILDQKNKENPPTYFVGRITWNGIRTLLYYVIDPKATADLLDNIIETGQYPREFEFKIEKDQEWKGVSKIIPNADAFPDS